jgi:eukaryotic-like serine/threonine-protein kinase
MSLPPDYDHLRVVVHGRYTLVRELGRGGMGLVCLAHDMALDRFVAIKTLPTFRAADTVWRDRFLREARAAAQLSHPNIVPIHAVEEHPDAVFFVMSYVPGESLGARIRRAGSLSVREGVRVLQEIAWALGHAHARGIVHRDIKPDNVLLDAETGRALVTDFGMAARDNAEAPAGGTVRFMSPEQAQGSSGGPASDVYAWGATAWVVAAGRTPFEGRSHAAVLAQQAAQPAPSFAMAAPTWPPRVAEAVDRALAHDPANRWPDADRLAAALEDALPPARVAPAPVRAFLREVDRVGSEIATLGTVTAVSGVAGAAMVWATTGFDNAILGGLSLFTAAVAGMATGARATALGLEARRMQRRGFGHGALQQVTARQAAEPDDEVALAHDAARTDRVTHAMQAGAGIAGTVLAYLVATNFYTGIPKADTLELVASAVCIVLPTFVARALWRLAVPQGGLVGRLLQGRLGAAFFRVAGLGLPRDVRPTAPDAALSELLALSPGPAGPGITTLVNQAQQHGMRARAMVEPLTSSSDTSASS